jgi:glycosyltransferase involved in cell wall biosynthesis
LQLPDDAFVIGSVGRLDPVKNFGALLEGLALLRPRFPNARAVVVGEGPERQALIDRAHALGVGNVTHFTGHRSDVRALMAGFDVYVNCSTYEGVSLTILEAMATALPVVATAVGGNPEVVVDQETGLLVDERPRALATAIATMASNPSQRRTMGDAGRWRVKRHFTIERMVNDYAAAYQVSRTSVTPNAAAAPATLPADCDSKAETPIG